MALALFTVLALGCPAGPAVNRDVSDSHYYSVASLGIVFSPGGNCLAECTKISGASVLSFAPLNDLYSIDRNNVFFEAQALSGEGPAEFRVAGGPYAAGKQGVYWFGEIIDGADPASFSSVEFHLAGPQYYGFDRRSVFCRDTVISDQPKEFHALARAKYFADKSDVYVVSGGVCQALGADPSTFHFLAKQDGSPSIYAKDAKTVFYLWTREVIPSADPTTFEALCEGLGPPHFARDRRQVYKPSTGLLSLEAGTFTLPEACKR
jgi:hypothetical protein